MNTEKVYHQLSESQKSIWYMEKTYPGTSINIIAGTLRLKCRVDFAALEEAINVFIRDNDALRLRMIEDGVEPKQYVSDYSHKHVDIIDFSAGDGLEDMYAWDVLQSKLPFQIIDADLFSFVLVKVSEDDGGFFIKMHHLIADAWTMAILGAQIVENYCQITCGEKAPGEPRPSYLELIQEEENYFSSARYQRDKAYWEEKFKVYPEPVSLKTVTSVDVRTTAARKTLLTPEKLSNKIRQYCRDHHESVFTLFTAALSMYIFRVLGKDDIVLGTTILNRLSKREKETVGMFASIGAPVRIKVDEEIDFRTLVTLITKESLSILRHQKYPYYQLLRDINKKHNASGNLFNTVLSYQNSKFRKNQTDIDYMTRWHFAGNQLETLAVNINDRDDDGNLILDYDYLCDVFNVKDIEFIHKHMISLLWHALDNPTKKISQLEMLSHIESKLILHEFNRTDAAFPADQTLHQIFESQAEKTPDHTAVISGDKKLTYREVNEKANQLARLIRGKGVKPDDAVGISLYRSERMIIGLLAILKAGGAYLPVDPEFPNERKAYMLENSGAKVLLCDEAEVISGFCGETIPLLDASIFCGDVSNPAAASGPRNLAYVIYTSGSTGRPKGVMIEHRSIVNRIHWMQKAYPLDEASVILQKTRFTFDVSVWELFWWSFVGARVCMLRPGGEKEPEILLDAIEENGVTTMHFVPSMLSAFLDYIEKRQCTARLVSLKHVFASGEALGITHAQVFNSLLNKTNGTALINLYGPTEAAVDVSHFNCSPSVALKSVPIGKPIDNIQLYILDKYMSMVPVGVAGELYIGGVGVGRGYINNPELTKERFVRNPYSPDDIIYKTGDRARWYPRGDIEYLGRIDFQVKIRGIRIELGEIENALHAMESVRDAVVTGVTYNDSTHLCAYVVVDADVDASKIKDDLSKKVPDYMIPAYIIFMDELPLLSNGKTNRNALPAPDFTRSIEQDFVEPQTEIEKTLARLWCRLLKLEKVGIHDNFFNIGGDSLSAIALIVQIHKELNLDLSVREVFNLKTIRQLAEFLENANLSVFKPVQRLSDAAYYPVSSAQKRLYILHQLNKDDISYNLPGIIELHGYIERDRIERVLQALVDRHETLRTSFDFIGEQPVQRIGSGTVIRVELSEVAAEALESEMKSFIRPFDLSAAPLMRARLVIVPDGRRLLLFDMHHIISDGTSMNILAREFSGLQSGKQLPELSVRYRDYAVWHNGMIEAGVFKEQEAYWVKRFSDELPVLNLPTDHPRPIRKGFRGRKPKFTIGKEATAGLRKMTAETGTTLYMALFAAYNILLHKYAGQDDIIVGIPVEGRLNADLSTIVGMFVNMLAIRNFPTSEKTFLQFLQEVKENLLAAYENQEYPFEVLVEKIKAKRDVGRNPLFDTSFVLQSFDFSQVDLKPGTGISSKFDLSLEAFDLGETIDILIEYSTDLFEAETVGRLMEHFLNILEDVIQYPWKKIADVNLLSAGERDLLLHAFSGAEADFPRAKTLQDIFEEQVISHPDHTAVVSDGKSLTYRQLNEKSNQLARLLRMRGVGPNKIVAISLYRSENMIVGLLGILKAGGAYLPIDPDYPEDRIHYMLQDSGAELLITQWDLLTRWSFDIGMIDIEDTDIYHGDASELNRMSTPNDLAYVIYTSGSTGRPKGVMIEHRSIVNRLHWMQKAYPLHENSVILQKTPFTFDVSVWELFWWSFSGAKVCMLKPGGEKDPEQIISAVEKNNVTTMHFVPSMLSVFLDYVEKKQSGARLASLVHVFSSGEALSVVHAALFNRLLNKTNSTLLVNLYGPTEAAVDVTYFDCSPTVPGYTVPIGKPIDNIRLYILDKNLNLVPMGIAGELYIGGVGVARGYINNPELSKERFITNPYAEDDVIYKTGDLCKWSADGNIEYLGRMDFQVKIRGVRIELGEIENRLLSHADISDALVVAKKNDNTQYICAYLVTKNETSSAEIEKFLKECLPEIMVPSCFIFLHAMPHLQNGKIDRKALPDPVLGASGRDDYIEPDCETEKIIQNIWCNVLGIDQVSVCDDFFEIGGDSLNAIRILSDLPEDYSTISLIDFYNHPTIRQLSKKINENAAENKNILIRLSKKQEIALTDIVCFPYGGGNAVSYRDLTASLSKLSDTYAIYSVNLPGHDLGDDNLIGIEEAAIEIVHEINRNLKNELILYSHCVGSALLIETARLLEAEGRQIRKIFIGGSLPPNNIIGKHLDPWMFFSDKRIVRFLERIGLQKSALENRFADIVIRAFRHDAKCYNQYFYHYEKVKIKKIETPVQCIIGEEDKITRYYNEGYKKWSRYIQDVTLQKIEKASHYFLNTHADELAAIINEK